MTTEEIADIAEPAEGTTGEPGIEVQTLAAMAASYPVAPGYRVNVRKSASSDSALVRVLAYDARVSIRCQKHGQKVSGPYGTSDIWDCIAPGEYVADAYVNTGSDGMVAGPCG